MSGETPADTNMSKLKTPVSSKALKVKTFTANTTHLLDYSVNRWLGDNDVSVVETEFKTIGEDVNTLFKYSHVTYIMVVHYTENK